jgi:uncharacterized protein
VEINGSKIIITGAASGIGAALLRQLADYRAHILAVDLNPIDDMPTGKANIILYTCDLSQPTAIDTMFDFAHERVGGVDLFIANAGFAYYGTAAMQSWEQVERLYRVNVFAPLYILNKMATLNPQTPYTVAITASAMAKIALPGYAHYAATKAALDRFVEAYRYEQPKNCHLMMIYPIATRTRFFQQSGEQTAAPTPHPNQTPAYVADRIMQGIQKDRERVSPSPGFNVYWALVRILPPLGAIYKRYGAWLLNRWLKRR